MATRKPSKTEINRQYNARNYDRIEVTVTKGYKSVIRQRANGLDKSINRYINDLIEKDMQKAYRAEKKAKSKQE